MNNLDQKEYWKNNIDKLLFILATVYLMMTMGWLWQQKQQLNGQNNLDKEINTDNLADNDRNSINNQQANLSADNVNQATELIPSIPLPAPEQVSSTAIINQNNSPSASENSTVPLRNNNLVLPAITPPPVPQQIIPPPPPQQLSNAPTASQLPTPTPVPAPPTLTSVPTLSTLNQNNTRNQVAVNKIPSSDSDSNTLDNLDRLNYQYSLVGIVQLNDQNGGFALFKINDVTEKVAVGAEIGASGWVLMAVNGKQAVVSRQNKSVNLLVGENF